VTVGESDGHSRSGGTGPLPGDSQAGAAPGASASILYTRGDKIPRRLRVTWWIGILLAFGFAIIVTPALTAERWLPAFGAAPVRAGEPVSITVRVPPFAGVQAYGRQVAGGGVIVARGDVATEAQATAARVMAAARPGGQSSYVAFFMVAFVFATLFGHHMRRSTPGRLLRVQIVSLVSIAVLAIAVKALMLTTATSILVVPVALLALVPTMALDRVVGLATGVLAALTTSLLVPFDVTVAILLLVQAAAAGLVIPEGPRQRWRVVLVSGLVATLLTAATLLVIGFLTRNAWPSLQDPLSSPWLAAAIGPAIAMALAALLLPLYQLLVGEVTHGRLVQLQDLSNPLLQQIAARSPGSWQHSLAMANMAEIAANAIGANGLLVRVGAYYHDLGKSLTPKYFIENLEPGETSPHDQLPPEVSCSAIFAHVTEGVAAARRAGLHERIIDFMHMHHGDGVLEYFWSKTQEQGNPRGLTLEHFRYPGHPPQSRETAILAIVDAVEAASRTLKRPEPAAIDALVQRIVYGKLDLGQLDESGLSMADLRRISASLRATIRHANHGRIEYPWQRAQREQQAAEAAASASASASTGTGAAAAAGASVGADSGPSAVPRPSPRRTTTSTGISLQLDSLDRKPRRETAVLTAVRPPAEILDESAPVAATSAHGRAAPRQVVVTAAGAAEDLAIVETAPQTPPAREPRAQAAQKAQADAIDRALDLAEAPARAPAAGEAARRPVGESTQLGLAPAPAPAGARPAPAPAGARPLSSHEDLETPVMPAMLGERVRAESRAESRAAARAAPRRPLPFEDMNSTEPSIPTFEPPAAGSGSDGDGAEQWASGLAARVAAAMHDEWSTETPIVPPTKAELRALLGTPDPTRQQSLDELDALHRASDELPSEPDSLAEPPPPRATNEVDPDQIEAAIELAPPARRPNVVAAASKPKKPE